MANDYDAMPGGDWRIRSGSSEATQRDGQPADLGRARSKLYEEWL